MHSENHQRNDGLFSEEMINRELLTWNGEFLNKFLSIYSEQIARFANSMAMACRAWKDFDESVQERQQRAHISSLLFGALNLHLMSTKFLIWGLLVPAGNTMRQVLEFISMALLASKPDLGYLDRYASGRYSTNYAVRDVIKHRKDLNLEHDALKILREARDFYSKLSHPTLLTIATFIELGSGTTHFGASFDPGKQEAYDKEVSTRVRVAGLLQNVIQGVRHNLGDEALPGKRFAHHP